MTKRDYAYNIIFAFTIPFIAVIRTIKSKSIRFKHQLLTLLIGVYGSTVFLTEGNDGYRHLAAVSEVYGNMPFKQFLYEIFQILTFQVTDSRAQDLYKHFLSYFCGAVLEMPFLFFPIVALVYGYFFSGSMLHIFRYFNSTSKNILFLSLASIFILLKNVEGINTVRTWTGLWVLVYACLKYYHTKELKYLFLMFIPPFIHFSYFIMALPAYLVLILGNWKKTYFTVFLLSFFLSILTPNPEAVTESLSQTELGQGRTKAYAVDEKLDFGDKVERQEEAGSNWYLVFKQAGIQRYSNLAIIIMIFLTGTYAITMSRAEASLFSIGLLTLTLSHVSWFYSALANRSALVGIVFIFAAILLTWQNPKRETNSVFFRSKFVSLILSLSFILYVPFILYKISDILGYISFFNLLAPFIVWIEQDLNMSIRGFVKVVIGMKYF
jgi:hypothetical protein